MSNKKQYTADDIRLYLEGKLTPAEMHALEKAALHDPFLADAIEGMRGYAKSEKFAEDVEELRMRLHKRTNRRKGTFTSTGSLWLKMAAVLFIVATGVAVILFTGQENDSDGQLAVTETSSEQTTTPDTSVKDAPTATGMLRDSSAQTLATNQERREPQPQAGKSSAPAEAAAPKDEPKAKTLPAPPDNKKTENEVSPELAKSAPLNVEKESKVAEQLQGRAAGVDIAKSEENDSTYQEVVVVGVGNSRARVMNNTKALSASQTKRRVMPDIGWDQFEQYMADSLNIATSDSVLTGEEEITFTIGPDGQPQSIDVLRSVSPSHDKEAIRLIQNGPAWKVVKGRRRNITLKLIF